MWTGTEVASHTLREGDEQLNTDAHTHTHTRIVVHTEHGCANTSNTDVSELPQTPEPKQSTEGSRTCANTWVHVHSALDLTSPCLVLRHRCASPSIRRLLGVVQARLPVQNENRVMPPVSYRLITVLPVSARLRPAPHRLCAAAHQVQFSSLTQRASNSLYRCSGSACSAGSAFLSVSA